MEKTENLSWSKRIKIAMLEKDMSQAELAERVGRTRAYVANIINGRIVSPPTMRLISDVLNVKWKE